VDKATFFRARFDKIDADRARRLRTVFAEHSMAMAWYQTSRSGGNFQGLE
jgi:hypothetical protein